MPITIAEEARITVDAEPVCGHCAEPDDEPFFGESDVPYHCRVCESLLPIPLTPAGYDYIEDAVLEHIASGGEHGRQEVLETWLEYYPEAVNTGLVDTIRNDLTRSLIIDLIWGALEK